MADGAGALPAVLHSCLSAALDPRLVETVVLTQGRILQIPPLIVSIGPVFVRNFGVGKYGLSCIVIFSVVMVSKTVRTEGMAAYRVGSALPSHAAHLAHIGRERQSSGLPPALE